MKRAVSFSVLLAGFLLSACPAPPPEPEPNPPRPGVDVRAIAERIRRDEARQVEDWASRDVDRIARRYAANGALIVPCLPRVTGIARIRAHIAALLEDPALELRFDPDRVDVAASGDLAYSVGTYTMRSTSAETGELQTESGNYLTTYRRQRDGSWKAVDDVAAPAGAPMG